MRTVFVLFDSLNRKAMAPYGPTPVKTPNFARFAQKSVTFDRHYVCGLPCMPARRDMQTGRPSFLHRNWGPLEPFDNSLPEILKKRNVYSHIVTDHNHYIMDGGATYLPRFSSCELVRGNGADHWKGVVEPPMAEYAAKYHKSQLRPYLAGYMNARETMVEEKDFCCPQVFDLGMKFIENNRKSDNWFLQIEAFDPHEPFFAPERFRKDYPTNYSGPVVDWPAYGRVDYSPDEAAEARANYAALVTMCDEYFGRLLDLFDRENLWQDTALIVSTDHGYLFGEHDWWGKNVMPVYDELARIPLLVYHPDFAAKGGERRQALTQTIDLMPTLLDFHGADIPPEVRGHSLRAVLEADAPIRDAAIYGYFGAACNVTDGRYTFLRYPEPMNAENLFEYTLMPTRMHERMGVRELAGAELSPPFDFSKGMPLLKIKPLATPENKPQIMEGRTFLDCQSALYDTATDPGQTVKLNDPAVVARLEAAMARLFAECDAPAEAYVRFGLQRPGAVAAWTTLEADFVGRLGRTFRDSEPWWPAKGPRSSAAPNILQIVFDDTGWADFGCFGSEIATPVLDGLAAAGLRYSNFHVTPLCSPTRACLLTGRNHHRVGMRFLSDIDTGFPNSRGRVDPAVAMVPEQLRGRGYGTYLVGKWHLTPQHEITPAGPFAQWPLARGFDRFYGFLDGCTDQFAPELYEDNHFREPPGGSDYDLTSDLADRAITLISDHAVFRPHDPFFLMFAPGATHAPLQAPHALIDKYVRLFEKGWDRVRAERLERQIAMGLVPAGTGLTPRNPGVPAWDELSADERRLFVRLQAAYAAFLEHADSEIGRILARLKALGQLDNTLVLVLSDNGASREGGRDGAVDINGPYSGVRLPLESQLDRIEQIGGPLGPSHYPQGWAMAGNTPFRRYKQSVDLGGVRSPLIVSWPARITGGGAIRGQFAHAIDLAATALDCAGQVDAGLDGASLVPTFAEAEAPAPRSTQYWEMFGHRAIWQDGWKAVTEHVEGDAYEEDRWRLYDTDSDFAEIHDLAAAAPERLAQLVAAWWAEARANHVTPLDDRTLVELLSVTRTPYQLVNRKRLVLRPENTHLPVSTGVTSTSRSMRLNVQLRGRRAGESGVLVASGSAQGGYCLYLRDDRLVFEHAVLGQRVIVAGSAGLPEGDLLVGLAIERNADESAQVRLHAGGRTIAEGHLPLTTAHPSFWGLDVGRDPVSPVSPSMADCPPWRRGIVETVALEFLEAMTEAELADLLAQTD